MTDTPDADLFRLFVEQTADIVIHADREGIIRFWNPAAEALFGYSTEEALGQTLDIIIPDRFRETHWDGFHHAMSTGETKYTAQLLPTRSVTKDGTTVYLEMRLSILRSDTNQIQGALAIIRDITERRAQERALRERVTELESQLSSGTDPS